MRPGFLATAIAIAVFLAVRRRRLGRETLVLGVLAAAAAAVVGAGLVELPNVEKIIEDLGRALGTWTYLLVGALAFLETGAFVGLIAPGETAVLVGGVVAAQGEIELLVLITIVWTCAAAGDLTSYTLGRKLGRDFLVRHGKRLRITEERLRTVEEFFDKHGGATILVGRFLGLVRALAPFIAGASRMPLRRFLPYDIVGSGLWATLFCVLGYVFWHSLDRVTQYVGRGVFLLGTLVAFVIAVVFVRRLIRDREFRARTKHQIRDRSDSPVLGPFIRRGIPLYRRFGRPFLRRLAGPARFVYERLTPGELGLEVTTLLALAAVGSYVAVLFGHLISGTREVLPLDRGAHEVADDLYTGWGVDLVTAVTTLGALPVAFVFILATAIWVLRSRRNVIDAGALVLSMMATWVAVAVWKHLEARPRPADAHVETEGFAYPSGHATYGVAYIACAVVLVRAGHGLAARFAAVTVAVVLAGAIALSRVYLRAHYVSDVVGGVALGVAIFALGGLIAVVVAHVRDNGDP